MRGHYLFIPTLVLVCTGCSGWRVVSVAPQAMIAESRPEAVRVTPRHGPTVTLMSPVIVGDSLLGRMWHDGIERRAIFLGDVATLETRRVDAFGTVAFAAFLGAAAYGVFVLTLLYSYAGGT